MFDPYLVEPTTIHERFTEGDCHILARDIHLQTGWPMATFMEGRWPDIHAFVKMPDGRYLDIDGVSTAREMRKRWQSHRIKLWTWEEMSKIQHWNEAIWPKSYGLAAIEARALLERYA